MLVASESERQPAVAGGALPVFQIKLVTLEVPFRTVTDWLNRDELLAVTARKDVGWL
jgi:hypothetical protein